MAEHSPKYTLLYHAGIPGRGEFIRLAFEATKTPYTDDQDSKVYPLLASQPLFAPPVLQIDDDMYIHQTPNILIYLAPKLGLEPDSEREILAARQIMFTALDLNNEAHDSHHPVGVAEYYENQKDEALRYSKAFRESRLPKYFAYFERCLKHSSGRYLAGDKLSIADITVFQVLDGLKYAFPNEMAIREKEFAVLFDTFYPAVKNVFKEYLASKRRLPYSTGIFRHYPELDRQTT